MHFDVSKSLTHSADGLQATAIQSYIRDVAGPEYPIRGLNSAAPSDVHFRLSQKEQK